MPAPDPKALVELAIEVGGGGVKPSGHKGGRDGKPLCIHDSLRINISAGLPPYLPLMGQH